MKNATARTILFLIICLGVLLLISATLNAPEGNGKYALALKAVNQPNLPIVCMLLFMLGVSLSVYLGSPLLLMLLIPYLLVAIPPMLSDKQDFIPAGAVLAFNSKHCPKPAWVEYTDLNGRVILGSNPKAIPVAGNDSAISIRILNDNGGAEKHELEISEMPSHNHHNGKYNGLVKADNRYTAGSADNHTTNEINVGSLGIEKNQGENQPHNNMPPFHVLTYCEKKG